MDKVREGIALCLSGGGYRALLFHLGALRKLNEIGLLAKTDRITSVSAGSILAGFLGVKWSQLNINKNSVIINLEEKIIAPLVKLTIKTIDISVAIKGLLSLGNPATI